MITAACVCVGRFLRFLRHASPDCRQSKVSEAWRKEEPSFRTWLAPPLGDVPLREISKAYRDAIKSKVPSAGLTKAWNKSVFSIRAKDGTLLHNEMTFPQLCRVQLGLQLPRQMEAVLKLVHRQAGTRDWVQAGKHRFRTAITSGRSTLNRDALCEELTDIFRLERLGDIDEDALLARCERTGAPSEWVCVFPVN